MRLLRDWSGIIFVVLLITGLLRDLSEISALTIVILGSAGLAYALCWYNFALVANEFKGLPIWRGLTVSTIGISATVSAVVNVGVSGPAGWFFLGLAMLGVGWGILKARLLPDGFAWLSGIAGIATILVGFTGDTSDVGTGVTYILLGWAISMSIMFIAWGHLDDDEQESDSQATANHCCQ